jgi:predicted Zn-dependent protease
VRRHSIKQMEQQQGANIGLTLACVLTSVCNSQAAATAIQVGGTALFAKFSRGDENEADEEGVRNVVRAGIDPNGIPEMFQILINERNASNGGGATASWFATHPLEEDRIAQTRQMIAQYSPAILRSLTSDSQNFQRFKARLRALPPSPAPRRQ